MLKGLFLFGTLAAVVAAWELPRMLKKLAQGSTGLSAAADSRCHHEYVCR